MRKLLVLLIVLAAAGGAGAYWYFHMRHGPAVQYRTATVTRGNLQATIGATGTIEPEQVIDVGAQVAGRVVRFGKDLRDPSRDMGWGSVVEDGTVLAELDPELYIARVESEKANVKKAEADKQQKSAKLEQAGNDWKRAENLYRTKSIAQADYDIAKTSYDTAKADLALSEAQILQTKASLREAQTNLDYTTIKSPVKGTIIDRRVNTGQTVVASLQAPSLFLIAKDLSKVEIWASVNEADIGQIHIGQPVRFTVDKMPGRVLEGKVIKQGDFPARLNASMTQNVVTYTVVISTENPEVTLATGDRSFLLWPYLTANLQFIVAERENVLLVPNSALRFRPKPDQIAPEYRSKPGKRKPAVEAAAAATKEAKESKEAKAAEDDGVVNEKGTIWVKEGEYLKPIRVRIGHTDGINTEVLKGDVTENMEVIIGEGRSIQAPTDANPFAPTFFKGKKKEEKGA